MNARSNPNYTILDKHKSTEPAQDTSTMTDQERAEYITYLEGGSAWDDRYTKFTPKK